MPINRLTKSNDEKKAKTLKLLSHHMCMKNAQTKNAFAVAIIIAIGNVNAGGMPMNFPPAEVTTVSMVRKINPKNTPNKSLGAAGWQNFGKSS